MQPLSEAGSGVWNRAEYRSLEGFVVGISPFNFTAIGGNIPSAPALMGNVVLWKPSDYSILSNWLVYEILMEAGLPAGVIQFVPAEPQDLTLVAFSHPLFAGLHFTGSTLVFKQLWRDIGANINNYVNFPRIVGEAGGKNFHLVHSSAHVSTVVHQTIRAAFEYQGQKCSACSRLFVCSSLWPEIKTRLISETEELKQGARFEDFSGPVIHEAAFRRVTAYIKQAEATGCKILAGGVWDDTVGWYIRPTILQTVDLETATMKEEIFGPVLTVYVYEDDQFANIIEKVKEATYALTGSIFATDRHIIEQTSKALRNEAGNFYINDKCTGAVVGQQPFGGSRASGTNDKAGSALNLLRWTSPRTIKENMLPLESHLYPSNQ
jgi:1-pyrroline-5-carboxylate dehydrogenase